MLILNNNTTEGTFTLWAQSQKICASQNKLVLTRQEIWAVGFTHGSMNPTFYGL